VRPVAVVYSTTHGGAEVYLSTLYSSLRTRGHRPHLIGSVPGWNEAGLTSTPIRLGPKWGGRTILRGLMRLPSERKALNVAIHDLEADLFHLQFKREQIGFTRLLSKRSPVVWTEHGVFPSGPKGYALRRAYARAARHTSAIICVSERVAKEVAQIVGPGVDVSIVENSVDAQSIIPPSADEKLAARRALGLGDGPVALWIGRLAKTKHPEVALQIARAFDGVVLIAGTGELLPTIQKEGGLLPNVRVMGHVSETSVLYRAADVALFTSDGAGEGLPTIFLEAGAHGVPTIVDSRSGFGPLITDDAGGIAVESGAAASAWVEAISAASDAAHTGAARKWAEAHDKESWAKEHEKIFRRIAGEV
jgi:glycosyltransferase involved in cell wall biosynthesis